MEIKELLEAKLNTLGDQIDAKIAQGNEAIKANLNEKLDNLKSQELTKLQGDYAEIQKQLDQMSAQSNRISGQMDARKSFEQVVSESINASAEFKAFRQGNSKSANISLDGKSLQMLLKNGNTMLPQNNLVGEVVPSQYVPGIIFDPDRAVHVRDFIPTATTTSDNIRYTRETLFTDYTGMVTPGSAKPKNEFVLSAINAPVETIAAFVVVHNNMLDDVPGMTGYLTARLPKKIKLKEDQQILYGTGNSPQLEGITTIAQAYVDTLADANVNRFDVLTKAIAQVRADEYQANAIMINVSDWYNLLLLKDQDGQYLMPEAFRFGAQAPRIAGVPLIGTTAITAGDFLVGDFAMGTQIFDRQQVNIRFFEQDSDNVQKNLTTVRVEERLTLANYRPSAFVYGNFAAALASGSA
jgi:HK97 family phage major capsid protein